MRAERDEDDAFQHKQRCSGSGRNCSLLVWSSFSDDRHGLHIMALSWNEVTWLKDAIAFDFIMYANGCLASSQEPLIRDMPFTSCCSVHSTAMYSEMKHSAEHSPNQDMRDCLF